MNCATARRFFSSCWDDELTRAERESFERHLAACASCRADYEALAHTLEAVAELPRAEAPPDFVQRALAAARRASPAPDVLPRPAPRWVTVTASAAVIALAVLVGYHLGSRPHPQAPASVAERAAAPAVPAQGTSAPASGAQEATGPGAPLAAGENVPESIFDHSADVELVLDPVVLYKGRPRAGLLPGEVKGEQAVITF